jgi:MarR family transcriptional regulator for hemolysin
MLGCQIIDDPIIEAQQQPLGRLIVFTAKALREHFELELARAGGSLGTWVVLNAISDEGFISQKALASRAHVDGATITHHVDRAEALGLVRRQVDPKDRRVRRLELTAEGKRLYRRLVAVTRDAEDWLFAGLDEQQRDELRRSLETIRDNLVARRGRNDS